MIHQKAVWGSGRPLAALAFVLIFASTTQAAADRRPHGKIDKVDHALNARIEKGRSWHVSSVIVELVPHGRLSAELKKYARPHKLDIINAFVLDLPDTAIEKIAADPNVFRVHDNRPLKTHNYRTAVTVGARTVQQFLGFTGAGVGIAVLDSGISTWHDDLTNRSSQLYPYGNQRVTQFVDFVNGQALPYDDNGHGTHVAGIIAGNGYDSAGQKAGIAPDASLVALKVLDADGNGRISNLIAALGWIAQNYQAYNIRVVNMSVGAAVQESYWVDPLTIAVKKVTDLGITVVAAAGNLGKNAAGQPQWGGITAPGNAPWVITVGASSTMGTLTRSDDTMASYSSAGPTYLDYTAKPDLVAPGTGTISLAVPGSTFYATKSDYLVSGSLLLGYQPYLALSGTSMAAPVVAGTAALMLQANPKLTPNLIKAILEYSAQEYPGYSSLSQGAGFLNTFGAVRVAQYLAQKNPPTAMPFDPLASRHMIWGNYRVSVDTLDPTATAWATNVVWGTASDDLGNIVWGTGEIDENIVWGTDCGGADCENIVWGTVDSEDNIVWGTADSDDNIVWGTSEDENIVWGTGADADVTWGSNAADAVMFPDDAVETLPSIELEFGLTAGIVGG